MNRILFRMGKPNVSAKFASDNERKVFLTVAESQIEFNEPIWSSSMMVHDAVFL